MADDIGFRCQIIGNCYIAAGTHIRDDVFIGPGVVITNAKYATPGERSEGRDEAVIGSGASIGANSTIIGGVRIGRGAVIGAGSVVTKDIPPDVLAYGNPCREIRSIKYDKKYRR